MSESHTEPGGHGHSHEAKGHGHSHGMIDRTIMRSRDGLKTVGISLTVLLVTSILQGLVFIASGSVALLADLIHNFGDALTAIPLGIAFILRSFVAERRAGYFVVATIFVSACVAAVEAVHRLIHPQTLTHLWALAAAGAVGFIGNEVAAQVRLRAGRRLNSPALTADGYHARTDGFVSLAVVASAIVVAVGVKLGDPIIGLAITLIILRITWQSIQTIKADPGLPQEAAGKHDDEAGHNGHADTVSPRPTPPTWPASRTSTESMATDTITERLVDEAGLGGASRPFATAACDSHARKAVSVQAANVLRNAGGGTWARRLRWRRATRVGRCSTGTWPPSMACRFRGCRPWGQPPSGPLIFAISSASESAESASSPAASGWVVERCAARAPSR